MSITFSVLNAAADCVETVEETFSTSYTNAVRLLGDDLGVELNPEVVLEGALWGQMAADEFLARVNQALAFIGSEESYVATRLRDLRDLALVAQARGFEVSWG